MNLFKSIKTKHLIEESIMLAIDSLSEGIQGSISEEDNAIDANSIKVLAEAYNIVHLGKKTYDF